MNTQEAIEILENHLSMKDGSEFLWLDYSEALTHAIEHMKRSNIRNALLREKIGIAIGEASMCWSEPPTGVFHSERAIKITDELYNFISDAPEVKE